MVGKMTETSWQTWRPALYAGIVEFAVCILLAIDGPDAVLFLGLVFVALPLVVLTIVLITRLIHTALTKRSPLLPVLATLAIIWAIPTSLFLYEREHPFEVREAVRWLFWSREYKREVMAQPARPNGDLKHIEWDGSGFVWSSDRLYLAFDPTDALLAVAKSHEGEFNGTLCHVYSVQRLERHWYAVLFYFDEAWDGC